jgi:hypothetical protein
MHRRRLYLAILAIAASAVPQAALALRIDYIVDLTLERNDNLLLTPTDPIAVTILGPGLGFEVVHDTSVLQARVTGRAEYLRYGDDRFDDSVDGTLVGRVNWVAIPERLSFEAIDSLTLQPVNTLVPDSPGNRQQVNVLSAGPTLSFAWGEGWRGTGELRYIRSDAEITDEFNSGRVDFALRAIKRLSPTSRLAFNAQHQRVDFERDTVARDYTRSELFVRWSNTLNRVDLALDAGYSRLDYRSALPGFADSRSDPLLRTSLAWRPSDVHRFEASLTSQFSDMADDSLSAIGEDAEPPAGVITGDTVVNASPYQERRLDTEYTWTATRWSLNLSPYLERTRYEDTDEFDQNGYGAGFEASWRARSNLMVGVTATLDHNEYLNLSRTDETRRYAVFARLDWTRHWSAMLNLGRYERSSTAIGQDADQNVFGLTLSYNNR